MEENSDGEQFEDRELEVETEGLEDEDDVPEFPNENAQHTGFLEDNEISMFAAGLASQNESENLAALEGMQKVVTGSEGERVLVTYVLASPQCVEVMSAWKRGPTSSTAVPAMLLLRHMFLHTLKGRLSGTAGSVDGPFKNDSDAVAAEEYNKRQVTTKLRLDKLARSILRSRMKDIYAHLSSNVKRRQNAALLLLSAIVLRGRALAIEIATSFDFTLDVMRKLGHPPKPKGRSAALKVEGHRRGILQQPTRVTFVEFAMCFLVVGDPGLLRWVLQKRPLWAGVLHGISKDDERTIIRVLTMIQKKIMTPDSLIPRGLQSVLFGDATLEQLTRISSDSSLEEARGVAHAVLLSLCTDPSHGLCPLESDSWQAALAATSGGANGAKTGGEAGGGGGGRRRLLRLALRLKVTEVENHRDLLLAIARNRPVLAALYLASIPLSLEPRVSPAWFNAMSIVSQLISIASRHSEYISSLAHQRVSPPATDSPLLQHVFLGLLPGSLSRGVLNRGLLHVDLTVKHACLRVLLESLLCLRQLTDSIENASSGEPSSQSVEPRRYSAGLQSSLHNEDDDCSASILEQGWVELSKSIQDTMRASLPDPSTLLALLSLTKASQTSHVEDAPTKEILRKRKREHPKIENEGLESNRDVYNKDETLVQLWGPEILRDTDENDRTDRLLHAKVVQVLAAYQIALPTAMEDAGFDAFKVLQDDAASLSVIQQKCLAALFSAAIGSSMSGENSHVFVRGSGVSSGSMYKKFKQLLLFLLDTNSQSVRDELYTVVHKVMATSRAFHSNPLEISLWLNPLLAWKIEKLGNSAGELGAVVNVVKSQLPAGPLRAGVVEFLSDAVSGIGRNIYKSLDLIHSIQAKSMLQGGDPERSGMNVSEFGPFVICALERCVQILRLKRKTPAERFTIALYVANVLRLLLKYQVRPQLLAAVIHSSLSSCSILSVEEQAESPEWSALLALFHDAQSILQSTSNGLRCLRSFSGVTLRTHGVEKLADLLEACRKAEDTNVDVKRTQFTSCLISASVQELIENFPLLVTICLGNLESDFSLLIAILGIYPGVLFEVARAWPGLFVPAMELAANAAESMRCSLTKEGLENALSLTTTHLGPPLVPEIIGLSVLFLVSPFSMMFMSATHWKGDGSSIPRAYLFLLLTSLGRLDGQESVCALRWIITGMQHVLSLSSEDVHVGSFVEMCFSLIRSLVLPVKKQSDDTGSLGCKEEWVWSSANLENVIIDLLAHPKFYNLFMNADLNLNPLAVPCSYIDDLRKDIKNQTLCDISLGRVLDSAASMIMVHPTDSHILSLIVEFLKLLSNSPAGGATSFGGSGIMLDVKKVFDSCGQYILKAASVFHIEINRSLEHGVAPSSALFAIFALVPYAQLPLLLGIFSSLLSTNALKGKSFKKAAAPHVLGLHLVTVFWDSVSFGLPNGTDEGDDRVKTWLWERKLGQSQLDFSSIQDLFEGVKRQVIKNPSITADLCMLSFLRASNLRQLGFRGFGGILDKLSRVSFVLGHSTPLEVLRHCVSHPNKVTGKIATMLVEMSPVHMAEFGQLLASGTRNVDSDLSRSCDNALVETLLIQNYRNVKMEALSNQDLLSLLPAAQVFVTSFSRKASDNGKDVLGASQIASVYVKIFKEQLSDWNAFVSTGDAIDGGEDLTTWSNASGGKFNDYIQALTCYNGSSLGQVCKMLQTCLGLHPLSVKNQSKLLQSLLLEDDQPFITQKVLLSGGEDLSQIVFEAVARAELIGYFLLLSQKSHRATRTLAETEGTDKDYQTNPMGHASQKSADQKQTFLWSLVRTLGTMYKAEVLQRNNKMVDSADETRSDIAKKLPWLEFLEKHFLLQVISVAEELAQFSCDIAKYVPLYRFAMTTLLGYRYGKELAMRASRYLAFVLYQGMQHHSVPPDLSVDGDVLDLLIAHSQFLPTLMAADTKRSHALDLFGKHVSKGAALPSLSSILSIIRFPGGESSKSGTEGIAKSGTTTVGPVAFTGEDGNRIADRKLKQHTADDDDLKSRGRLQFMKLLRILLAVRLKQLNVRLSSGLETVPLDEILALLLAAYGGSMSAMDQEIFSLMKDLERHGGLGFSGLAQLDYLWGEEAALQRGSTFPGASNDVPETQDGGDGTTLRKEMFREHLMIEPRRCGLTVLFFPLRRKFNDGAFDHSEILNEYSDGVQGDTGVHTDDADKDLEAAAYDPAFLLRFALHSLSSSLLSAEEFVRLGLLAVTFSSMSSAEESMRKAGYDVLASYFNIMRDGPSFKGRPQIQLLMNYMKNSVAEPWQRIPAVFTTFAAEATFILMHPENHHYMIVNRYLLRSPSLDFESVPLFQAMFGSASVQYRSDRLWMLRLLAAGLRTPLDARVYRRKFILEILMSFHGTTLADALSRKWILQVLHQAAGVRSCARYLVVHTGFLSWLALVTVNDVEGNLDPESDEPRGQLALMSLQVMERVMSWRIVQRHFFHDCLEELSRVGHIFYRLLVSFSILQHHEKFRRSTLKLLLTLVQISQKRSNHQTHFTLSLGGLSGVIDWVACQMPRRHGVHTAEDTNMVLQLLLHVPPSTVYLTTDKSSLLKAAKWALIAGLQQTCIAVSGEFPKFSLRSDTTHGFKSRSQVTEGSLEKLLRWLAASIILSELARTSATKDEQRSRSFASSWSVVEYFQGAVPKESSSSAEANDMLASLLLALESYVSVQATWTSLLPVVVAVALLTQRSRISDSADNVTGDHAQVTLLKIQGILKLLLSELPAVEEVNPSWQWSFKTPWTRQGKHAPSAEESAVRAQYSLEICRTLLGFFHQLLSKRPSQYHSFLSHWGEILSQNGLYLGKDDSDPVQETVRRKLGSLQGKLLDTLLESHDVVEVAAMDT